MSDGKIRTEVLIGSLLLVIGLFVCIGGYLFIHGQVDTDLANYASVRDPINTLVAILMTISILTLFIGAIAGYLIGKYRNTDYQLRTKTKKDKKSQICTTTEDKLEPC